MFMIPILIIILTVLVDQLSKQIVIANMELFDSFTLIDKIINVTYYTNKGAAFGILKNHRWIFMIISAAAIIVMLVLIARLVKYRKFPLMQVAIALIAGGGIGNMIDRIRLGYVVDFLEFDFVDFAIFNLADTFVTVGSCFLCLYIILDRNRVFSDSGFFGFQRGNADDSPSGAEDGKPEEDADV